MLERIFVSVTMTSLDLPAEIAFELTGHQGPVRAVRFNSTFFIQFH